MFSGNDQGLPQVPYATALELYVQMCFTFLILSMFEFVGVHYFTKHGGGDYHNIGKFFRVTILKSFLFLHYRGVGPSFTLKSTTTNVLTLSRVYSSFQQWQRIYSQVEMLDLISTEYSHAITPFTPSIRLWSCLNDRSVTLIWNLFLKLYQLCTAQLSIWFSIPQTVGQHL